MEKIDKTPRDKNNNPHGLWVLYYSDGKFRCKGNYIHGICDGLFLMNRFTRYYHKIYYIK